MSSSGPLGARARPRARTVGLVTGLAVALALAGLGVGLRAWLGGGSTPASVQPASAPAGWVRPTVSSANLARTSGVTITQLALTGEGGLIDLRYQIIDPNKAAVLHDEQTPPAVVDEQSGIVANQLFMQHSHSGPFTFGETYYLVFDNPGNVIQRGDRVTVLLGDAQVEHVLVR